MKEVESLEASGRAALPALHEEAVGGWLLRVTGGQTKRVNSANPLPGAAPVATVRAHAEALYAAHGLPCRFRLTPLAPPDADQVLADEGYRLLDRSSTMAAPLVARSADPALHLTHVASAGDLASAGLLSDRTGPDQAIHLRLLGAIPGAKAFAVLFADREPVAAGYASIGEGRAQLSDIVTRADARGRGHGRRLVAGLLGWAHDGGCAQAMLQVLDTNTAARRLYRSLGFVDAYPYHYRVAP